jgi:hypothetical protein
LFLFKRLSQFKNATMKKTKFKIEEFACAGVETLDAGSLKLIVGAYSAAAQCSTSNDTDGKSDDCSGSGDTDLDPSGPGLPG